MSEHAKYLVLTIRHGEAVQQYCEVQRDIGDGEFVGAETFSPVIVHDDLQQECPEALEAWMDLRKAFLHYLCSHGWYDHVTADDKEKVENISGGDGVGDDSGAEGGDDDFSGPDAAAAPGQRLRADQAAISQLVGETAEVKDVTWTVVEFVGDLDGVAPDVLQAGRDVFAPASPSSTRSMLYAHAVDEHS